MPHFNFDVPDDADLGEAMRIFESQLLQAANNMPAAPAPAPVAAQASASASRKRKAEAPAPAAKKQKAEPKQKTSKPVPSDVDIFEGPQGCDWRGCRKTVTSKNAELLVCTKGDNNLLCSTCWRAHKPETCVFCRCKLRKIAKSEIKFIEEIPLADSDFESASEDAETSSSEEDSDSESDDSDDESDEE